MCLREARLQALCWQSTQNSSNRRFAVDPGWSGRTRTVWIGVPSGVEGANYTPQLHMKLWADTTPVQLGVLGGEGDVGGGPLVEPQFWFN
jgi:hypothetical protein